MQIHNQVPSDTVGEILNEFDKGKIAILAEAKDAGDEAIRYSLKVLKKAKKGQSAPEEALKMWYCARKELELTRQAERV